MGPDLAPGGLGRAVLSVIFAISVTADHIHPLLGTQGWGAGNGLISAQSVSLCCLLESPWVMKTTVPATKQLVPLPADSQDSWPAAHGAQGHPCCAQALD